jgi:hypothetical protein
MSASNDIEGKAISASANSEIPASAASIPASQAQLGLALPQERVSQIASIATPADASPPVVAVTGAPEAADIPHAADAPRLAEMPKPADISPSPLSGAASVNQAADAAASHPSHRLALLAASMALAGAIGAMAGALSASAIAWIRSSPAPASALAAKQLNSLQDTIGAMRREIATLKSNVEAGVRSTNAQFGKISERIERSDRAHVEPVAKLAKAVEALQRRADAAQDATGSVSPPRAAAAGQAAPPPQPRVQYVDGWILRGVNRGVAYIQGRTMGLIEVEQGDVVPGIGRIEAIRRQDGRWVVVTSRGLIAAAR